MLEGNELLAMVKEMKDASRDEIVRACGYVTTKADGSERLKYSAFYEAILTAKDVDLPDEPDQHEAETDYAPPKSESPIKQLPRGVYWVGDLSYVFDDFFEEGLDGLEGVHTTKDGHLFAIYHTAGGDGIFSDNDGDEYGVDVANIGCIPIDAIEETSDLGHVVRFHYPFICRWIEDGGFICFGDLVIKTDSLSDSEYPDALNRVQGSMGEDSVEFDASNIACAEDFHIKLGPYGLMDLILPDEDEVDSDTQLVLQEIASYIMDGDPGELLDYADASDEDKRFLIEKFHLVFHSGLEEFTEYFRGYYSTPDNGIHAMNLEEGRTGMELNAFLEKLDWPQIFALCRRNYGDDSVAKIFQGWTGLDYEVETTRYPIGPWDGTPRWPIEDGKYLPSK
jgi:hypothetical protein